MWHAREHCEPVGWLSGREGGAVEGELCNGPAVGETLDIFPSGWSGERRRAEQKKRNGGAEEGAEGRGREGCGRGREIVTGMRRQDNDIRRAER